ncbi:MAG: hypothetical protein AAGB02_01430 [Pseudomonadota bacterium]
MFDSTFNTLNQPTSLASNLWQIDHDQNGNFEESHSVYFGTDEDYAYDAHNRLQSHNDIAGDTTTLSYDAAGRLKQTSKPTASTWRFVYAGDQMIAEYDRANRVRKRYIHGLSGAPTPFNGVDEPLVEIEYDTGGAAIARRFLHADERGSIVAASFGNGTFAYKNSYDSQMGLGPRLTAIRDLRGVINLTGSFGSHAFPP